MSLNLQVFLISPDNVVVYSFDNSDNNDNYIYNGGSLELIHNPEITSYTEIAGTSTPDFKTNPMVLGYANGLFEIVYAPNAMDMLFLADGSPAQHNSVPVVAKSLLIIPDMERTSSHSGALKLIPFDLDAPNMDSVQKYIQMARAGQEYDTKENYWELRSVNAEKSLPKLTINKAPEIAFPAVEEKTVSNNEVCEQLQKDIVALQEEIQQRPNADSALREDFNKLRDQMEALTRRLYKIYPVDLPKEIEFDGKMCKVLSVAEIKEKLDAGEIERMLLAPLLQAYAGSYRGDNRLLTFYTKDGSIYHVRASYNVTNNKFDEPVK